MKKILTIVLLFSFIPFIKAKQIEVTFSACVDGDTAKFVYNNNEIVARFLAIDTPETVHPTKEDEKYGKESSNYTCKKIKEANNIILEFDSNSEEKDKYDRYLVWVFVDDILLQKDLVKNGLAEVAYLYGEYKYTNILKNAEEIAKENKVGIWENIELKEKNNVTNKDNKEKNKITVFIEKYKDYILLIGALIIVSVFNLKSKKKIKNKLKRKINKDIKKRLK